MVDQFFDLNDRMMYMYESIKACRSIENLRKFKIIAENRTENDIQAF